MQIFQLGKLLIGWLTFNVGIHNLNGKYIRLYIHWLTFNRPSVSIVPQCISNIFIGQPIVLMAVFNWTRGSNCMEGLKMVRPETRDRLAFAAQYPIIRNTEWHFPVLAIGACISWFEKYLVPVVFLSFYCHFSFGSIVILIIYYYYNPHLDIMI